jgi:hypothetical protein
MKGFIRFRSAHIAVTVALVVLCAFACSSAKKTATATDPTVPAKTSSGTSPSGPNQIQLLPLCGNGLVESGEECDGGACCASTCKLIPAHWKVVCDPHPEAMTLCTGGEAECPTKRFVEMNAGLRMYDPARGVTP